ncbi:hypothetical protein [Paenibacillus senegalimassiliensis]|uniref:hypothetical protein n=1 Tax=Paenibacillus senegalimassiliensis TaxID=1737426 RepID=UPI00073F2D9F|nr:hypothetical protein [Paenibacillus senegalimassiliensis]
MKRNEAGPAFTLSLQNYQGAVKQLLGQIEENGQSMPGNTVEESFEQLLRLNKRIAGAFLRAQKSEAPSSKGGVLSPTSPAGTPTVHSSSVQLNPTAAHFTKKNIDSTPRITKTPQTTKKAKAAPSKAAVRGARPLINTRLGVKK